MESFKLYTLSLKDNSLNPYKKALLKDATAYYSHVTFIEFRFLKIIVLSTNRNPKASQFQALLCALSYLTESLPDLQVLAENNTRLQSNLFYAITDSIASDPFPSVSDYSDVFWKDFLKFNQAIEPLEGFNLGIFFSDSPGLVRMDTPSAYPLRVSLKLLNYPQSSFASSSAKVELPHPSVIRFINRFSAVNYLSAIYQIALRLNKPLQVTELTEQLKDTKQLKYSTSALHLSDSLGAIFVLEPNSKKIITIYYRR